MTKIRFWTRDQGSKILFDVIFWKSTKNYPTKAIFHVVFITAQNRRFCTCRSLVIVIYSFSIASIQIYVGIDMYKIDDFARQWVQHAKLLFLGSFECSFRILYRKKFLTPDHVLKTEFLWKCPENQLFNHVRNLAHLRRLLNMISYISFYILVKWDRSGLFRSKVMAFWKCQNWLIFSQK